MNSVRVSQRVQKLIYIFFEMDNVSPKLTFSFTRTANIFYELTINKTKTKLYD